MTAILLSVPSGDDGSGALTASVIAIIICLALWAWLLARKEKMRAASSRMTEMKNEAASLMSEMTNIFSRVFSFEPCTKCNECEFEVKEVTPTGRSILVECGTCHKQAYFHATGTDNAAAVELWSRLCTHRAAYTEQSYKAGHMFGLQYSIQVKFDVSQGIYVNQRKPIPDSIRKAVWLRDKGMCVQCGVAVELQFDHIIPVSKGGATTIENLQLLCGPCNRVKGASI